jgi:N-acetyl-anhydromuramyl-L-alanine amidase AmpD
MIKMEIATTPNKEKGRRGLKPDAIVIHVCEGDASGALSWLTNPKSQVSYHFVVCKNGDVISLVSPEDTAWANGLVVKSTWPLLRSGVNPNLHTISISFAGFALEGPTRQQAVSIAELVENLTDMYKIPLDEIHVISHSVIRTDKLCAGAKFDIKSILWLARLAG